MDTVALERIASIPTPADGYALVAKSVAGDGSLLFLFVESSARDDVFGTYRNEFGAGFPVVGMERPKRFRLVRELGGGSSVIDLPPLAVTFPRFDVFPDDRILVAASRCAWRGSDDYDLNGVICDPATGRTSSILLGDGIAHLYIDRRGLIWVGYFDEGVFGNCGWGAPGPFPVGAAGVVCFLETGEKLWEFPGQMADCYALNVFGDQAAIYCYPDFPIYRVSSDFQFTHWTSNLSGCHWLALTGPNVLMSGQYEDPPDVAYAGVLRDDRLSEVRQIRLELPDDERSLPLQFKARGGHAYFFGESSVYRVSVDRAIAR